MPPGVQEVGKGSPQPFHAFSPGLFIEGIIVDIGWYHFWGISQISHAFIPNLLNAQLSLNL